MADFEARNVKITVTEFTTKVGSQAFNVGFTSDWFEDGVQKGVYPEDNIGLDPRLTIEQNVTQTIQRRIAAWQLARTVTDGQVIGTVQAFVPPPDPVPTQDELDEQAFTDAMKNYLSVKAQYDADQAAKIQSKDAPTLQGVTDAYSAWKATYIKPEYAALIPKDFPYL